MSSTTPMSSYFQRPRPGRRRTCSTYRLPMLRSPFLLLLVILVSFCTISAAVSIDVDAYVNRSPEFRRLERRGKILTVEDVQIERRDGSGSSSSSTPTSSITSAETSTASATITASSAAVTAESSPLPSPFDTSLGNNFTSQSCPDFFNKFLSNATFKACLPVSLLLQNSQSFFQASRSPLLLSLTLDTACAADQSVCVPLMQSLADEIMQDSNCGQDYQRQNPLVLQAHAGLESYEPIFQATCIKNTESGNYCFADAITNASNPRDSYPYYIALGIELPGGSRPTCNKCLQDTMAVFATAAEDKNQPVSATYIDAAQLIDVNCGPTFVNATVPVATVSSGSERSISALDTTLIVSMAALLGLTIAL